MGDRNYFFWRNFSPMEKKTFRTRGSGNRGNASFNRGGEKKKHAFLTTFEGTILIGES